MDLSLIKALTFLRRTILSLILFVFTIFSYGIIVYRGIKVEIKTAHAFKHGLHEQIN